MSQLYSLETLWTFSEPDIHRILQYFGNPILNNPNDRLNAVILAFNNNLLAPEDRPYVASPHFNQLFLASDPQLIVFAQQYGLTQLLPHIALVKFIIDRINQPVIPVVTTIPTETTAPLAVYQMGQLLYLCGRGTYNLRDQLRALGGTWNPAVKCWSFPLTAREGLLNLLPPPIPASIPNITQVPAQIPGDLQVYQMGGRVLVCGRRTFDLQERLRNLGGTFDRNVNCWNFPPERAQSIINLMNELQQEIQTRAQQEAREAEARRQAVQARRQETRTKAQEEARLRTQEEMARLSRLQTPEPEAPYISRVSRLTPGVDQQLRRQAAIEDAEELRRIWGDQIQVVRILPGTRSTREALVTYTGNIKPPDSALALFVDNWSTSNFGWQVERVDYKTYRVSVFTD